MTIMSFCYRVQQCSRLPIYKVRRMFRTLEMAGVAGLEPVTSAVTGQRSNQLSYTPAPRDQKGRKIFRSRQGQVEEQETIRAADAKEVGVGNPAEETYRYPNHN